jgi:threonylcarbamoyladenosine tRNA methylthiotransferase MtaB
MRVYLETLGCRLNYAEMAALGRQLAGAGHAVVGSAAEADVCVLNTCAVTGEAARKSRQMARQLGRANPNGRVVVTGCYATLEGATVANLPGVALVVGNERKEALLELIAGGGQTSGLAERSAIALVDAWPNEANSAVELDGVARDGLPDPTTAPAIQPAERTRAFIKVQDGCHNRCTFCIVTVARGAERSRPVADVVTEINALHETGYQEAVLTGVHLGAYGREQGTTLGALVAALLTETNIPRLRLSSLEPFDLAPEFFELWAAGGNRLMPHLHLPAQSGSDPVLRRMARRNRVADFEVLLAAARAAIPGLTVTTDIIVGFPGESEADYAATLAFAERAEFAHIHVFPYSARAGTAAARMSGQIPEAERRRRSRALNALEVQLGQAVRMSFLGQTRPVLWENTVPASAPGPGLILWEGLTDNYLRVRAAAPAGLNLHNRITETRLPGMVGPDLSGELLESHQFS